MTINWENTLSSADRRARALLAAGLLLGLLMLFLVTPENLPFATCAFHELTGHSCLTCGLTRSLHAVSHGHLAASFRLHLMGPVVFIGLLLVSIVWSIEALSGIRLRLITKTKIKRHAIVVLLIIWLSYWGIRLLTEISQ
jgi:hypothetical protein